MYKVSLLERNRETAELKLNTLKLDDEKFFEMISSRGFILNKEYNINNSSESLYEQYSMLFKSSIRHTNCVVTSIARNDTLVYSYGGPSSHYVDKDFLNTLDVLYVSKHPELLHNNVA